MAERQGFGPKGEREYVDSRYTIGIQFGQFLDSLRGNQTQGRADKRKA